MTHPTLQYGPRQREMQLVHIMHPADYAVVHLAIDVEYLTCVEDLVHELAGRLQDEMKKRGAQRDTAMHITEPAVSLSVPQRVAGGAMMFLMDEDRPMRVRRGGGTLCAESSPVSRDSAAG